MKKLSDCFYLIYNDIDCAIFKNKEELKEEQLSMKLLQTGCFYGDERYIRISKRSKSQITYSIITSNKEVRTYSAYYKNDADIMRQINMIYQMCVYDYGIIICQAVGDNSLQNIKSTLYIQDITSQLYKEHEIAIKKDRSGETMVYKDGYLWCTGCSIQFIKSFIKQRFDIIQSNNQFVFKTKKLQSLSKDTKKEK